MVCTPATRLRALHAPPKFPRRRGRVSWHSLKPALSCCQAHAAQVCLGLRPGPPPGCCPPRGKQNGLCGRKDGISPHFSPARTGHAAACCCSGWASAPEGLEALAEGMWHESKGGVARGGFRRVAWACAESLAGAHQLLIYWRQRAPVAPRSCALAALQAKSTSLQMGLESITDTNGPLGGLKWFAFFGASFVPSLFLAGYFLGGYYPGLAVGAAQEPAWWPTAMQVHSHAATSRSFAPDSRAAGCCRAGGGCTGCMHALGVGWSSTLCRVLLG